GNVTKIIVNNKEKHPDAHLIEVSKIDLDHDLFIEGYELDEEEDMKRFTVDERAIFVMDEQETQIAPYDRQVASKTVGQRAMQLFAGPMMNFILAIVIFVLIGLFQGVPTEEAIIGEVVPDSPASEAGMKAGDEVIEVDGKSIDKWDDFTAVIQKKPNETVELIVQRGNDTETLQVIPVLVEQETPEGGTEEIGQAGVQLAFEKSFFKSFSFGFERTIETTQLIIQSLFMLITGP